MFDYIASEPMVNERRQQLVTQQEQQYKDLMDQLAANEQLYRNQFQTGQDSTQAQLQTAQQLADQQAQVQASQQQRNYGDMIAEARRRARAMGGVTGSGVMDLYGGIDRNLQQNLYNIGLNRANTVNSAQQSANEQLARLQSELEKNINAIQADRTKSLREKDAAINEISYQAMAAAARIKAARAASGSGYYGAGGYTSEQTPMGNVLGIDTMQSASPYQDALEANNYMPFNSYVTSPTNQPNTTSSFIANLGKSLGLGEMGISEIFGGPKLVRKELPNLNSGSAGGFV